MSTIRVNETVDARIARLERCLGEAIHESSARSSTLESRVARLELQPQPELELEPEPVFSALGDQAASPGGRDDRPAGSPDRSGPAATVAGSAGSPTIPAAVARDWDPTALSDLVGGRILAWLGGVAVVLAILLFLALAVSHGWIDRQARVLLAGAASTALLTGGVWLRGHLGRTEAAATLVGAGTAAMFATLIVTGDVYRLAPPLACLGAAILVGAVATALAVRWAGRAIAALGLGGALLAPVLVGATPSLAALAMLGVAAACAMWVATRQNWSWLGLGALIASAPQWGAWSLGDRPALAEVVVLGGFALLGLAAGEAAGLDRDGARRVHEAELGTHATRRRSAWVWLIALNSCVCALVGYAALGRSAGHTASVLWLVGLAVVHVALALAPRRRPVSREARDLLLAVGLLLGDVAFGLSADGILLTAGWGAASVGLAWRARRTTHGAELLELGLGTHIGLVLIRVVLIAPPDSVTSGAGGLVALLSISTLAACSLACARLSRVDRPVGAAALNLLGLVSIAYLTAGALDGTALAAAWAAEGLGLIRLARRSNEETAWIGGLAFVGLAAGHVLTVEAPPSGLLHGSDQLRPAAVAIAAFAGSTLAAGRLHRPASRRRRGFLAICAIAALYLASIALVTAIERDRSGSLRVVLDLSIRQEAQVALSGLWSLTGLTAVTIGLRRRLSAVRVGGLVLLLVTVAKVFAYDLSALDSIYRVASVLMLGLLLLVAALTYQRLRPPTPPDLRTLHPSQR